MLREAGIPELRMLASGFPQLWPSSSSRQGDCKVCFLHRPVRIKNTLLEVSSDVIDVTLCTGTMSENFATSN